MIVLVVGAGDMGAGLGAAMVRSGADVVTLLDGRSAATAERARAAGMHPVDAASVSDVDFILSVLPPSRAVSLAEQLAPALASSPRKPIYVDCNPLRPSTLRTVQSVIEGTGTSFVDGGIIGLTPRVGYAGPIIYVAGNDARRVEKLNQYGLHIRVLDGECGAASALKLSYAAITKGLLGAASAAIIGATEAGIARALWMELSESQPGLMAFVARGVPDMFGKAGRWVAEMEEISGLLGSDTAGGRLYQAYAGLFADVAASFAADGAEVADLRQFFKQQPPEPRARSERRTWTD